MTALDLYAQPEALPASDAARIGRLLGLNDDTPLDDVALAERVSQGLKPTSAAALGQVIGMPHVVGKLIPEATLRRARTSRKPLSREMSERLYEVGRVVDLAKYDNRSTGDEGDNYLYAWRLTGCPAT